MAIFFDLEIALVGIEPAITRRFLLSDKATLQDLHVAIQDLTGWQDRHLHDFRTAEDNGQITDLSAPEDGYIGTHPEPYEVDVADAFNGRDTLFYAYDYGDSWIVRVTNHGRSPLETPNRRVLLVGARAFPMDDMGGLSGYERCVAIVFNRDKPRDKDMREWTGRDFPWDPDVFDVIEARRRFDSIKLPRPRHEPPPRKKVAPATVSVSSSKRSKSSPALPRNAWCEKSDIDPPDVLAMTRDKDVKIAHLAVAVLYRRGVPTTLDDLADELARIGVTTGTGDLRLSIQRAFASPHTPVKRDRPGRFSPDFSDPNLFWVTGQF